MILGNNTKFLVNYLYVAGSNLGHQEGDFIITSLLDNYYQFDLQVTWTLMKQTGSLNLARCPELATNQFFKQHTFQFSALLRLSKVLFFMRLNMSRYAKKGYMASKKYFKHFFEVIYLYSVHPRFAKGVESPTKFSKRGT